MQNQKLASDVNTRFGYLRPLVDAGDHNGEQFRGIFTPTYDDATVRRYVQTQFLDDAEHYATHWRSGAFKPKMQFGLDLCGSSHGPSTQILDLGSGAGNSIFPLLELIPGCSMLATDLSLEMLRLLRDELRERDVLANCATLQLNAEELDFEENSFDLVVGAFILHHLHDPARTIEGCSRILKKGGHAIFYEPFESGHIVLRDAFEEILTHPQHTEISEPVREFLKAINVDINARLGTDKSDPSYQLMDDKWLFPNEFFNQLASLNGFSRCQLKSPHDGQRLLKEKATALLRQGLGKTADCLPDWAWDTIDRHEIMAAPEGCDGALIQGCIVLTK